MSRVNVSPESGGSSTGSGSRAALTGMMMGVLFGLIVLIVLLLVAWMFLQPLLTGGTPGININLRLPQGWTG